MSFTWRFLGVAAGMIVMGIVMTYIAWRHNKEYLEERDELEELDRDFDEGDK